MTADTPVQSYPTFWEPIPLDPAPAPPPAADAYALFADAAEEPRALVVVPSLPMLDNGKVDRLAVRELAGTAR